MKLWLLSPTRGNRGSHTRIPAAPQYSLRERMSIINNRWTERNVDESNMFNMVFRKRVKPKDINIFIEVQTHQTVWLGVVFYSWWEAEAGAPAMRMSCSFDIPPSLGLTPIHNSVTLEHSSHIVTHQEWSGLNLASQREREVKLDTMSTRPWRVRQKNSLEWSQKLEVRGWLNGPFCLLNEPQNTHKMKICLRSTLNVSDLKKYVRGELILIKFWPISTQKNLFLGLDVNLTSFFRLIMF